MADEDVEPEAAPTATPVGSGHDEPDEDPVKPDRAAAPQRRDDSERAIGLEVARLFGMNPRQLVKRRAPRPEGEEPSGG